MSEDAFDLSAAVTATRRRKRARKLVASMEDRIANFRAYRTSPVGQHDAQLMMEALVLLLKDRFDGAE